MRFWFACEIWRYVNCVIKCHAFREQFVTYAWQMARHGANCASPCRLERLRATKMARRGTPCCGALREQNSCLCQACFTQNVKLTEPHEDPKYATGCRTVIFWTTVTAAYRSSHRGRISCLSAVLISCLLAHTELCCDRCMLLRCVESMHAWPPKQCTEWLKK